MTHCQNKQSKFPALSTALQRLPFFLIDANLRFLSKTDTDPLFFICLASSRHMITVCCRGTIQLFLILVPSFSFNNHNDRWQTTRTPIHSSFHTESPFTSSQRKYFVSDTVAWKSFEHLKQFYFIDDFRGVSPVKEDNFIENNVWRHISGQRHFPWMRYNLVSVLKTLQTQISCRVF